MSLLSLLPSSKPHVWCRRSHWNAEVSTKNFWWMYFKAAARGSMSKCGCLNLGWTPGAGGKKVAHCYTKLCEARGDLYPHMFSAVSLQLGPAVCSVQCRLISPHCELTGEHNGPAAGACPAI